MALQAISIRNAKSSDKAYKLSDEKGLYLLINPTGGKFWKLKYRFGGKEKKLSLGEFPEVGLSDARIERDEARKLLRNGIDPSDLKKTKKNAKELVNKNSFKAIAYEWHTKSSPKWTSNHAKRIIECLEKDIFPWLGSRPISEITAPE